MAVSWNTELEGYIGTSSNSLLSPAIVLNPFQKYAKYLVKSSHDLAL